MRTSSWNHRDKGVDLAVATLVQPVTSVPPAALPRDEAAFTKALSRHHKVLAAVGYGIDTKLTPVLAKAAAARGHAPLLITNASANPGPVRALELAPWGAGNVPVFGDSGGPLLGRGQSGERLIFGVVSYKDKTFLRKDRFYCVPTWLHLDWIRANAPGVAVGD
jgi:hypothetical protein